ncbi:MAG: hypothetical protein ABI862_08260 [Ilumatobacteraceae bacterium]
MRRSMFSRLDARRWSGLRRSALVTSLICASVLVGSGLLVPSVAAAALQMQGTQIDATNTNTYGDGVASATASGYLTNSSFIAGQYEYATVRSVAGAVIGLNILTECFAPPRVGPERATGAQSSRISAALPWAEKPS